MKEGGRGRARQAVQAGDQGEDGVGGGRGEESFLRKYQVLITINSVHLIANNNAEEGEGEGPLLQESDGLGDRGAHEEDV